MRGAPVGASEEASMLAGNARSPPDLKRSSRNFVVREFCSIYSIGILCSGRNERFCRNYKNLSLVTIVSFTGDSLYSQLEKERWKIKSCHREVCEPKSPKSIHSQNAKRERWPTWGIRANPSNPWSPPSRHRTTKLQACSCHNRKNNDNRQILIELHLRSDQFFQLWSHLLKDKVASGSIVCLDWYFPWSVGFINI